MLYESIIMLSLYILYIAIMKVNFKLMELLAKIRWVKDLYLTLLKILC